MKVLLRAPLLTLSGYGVHSRQIFEWLKEKEEIDLDVECLNWGMTPWIINAEHEQGLIGKIMSCSRKLNPPYDVTFQVQLPDEWNPDLGNYNIGISAVVETDKCNPEWITRCNLMDEIIVPSEFTKNVLLNTGLLKKKVTVIPEWFNQNIPKQDNEIKLPLKTDFNFLVISQLNSQNPQDDRKNIYNTIKWLCEEFKGDSNVGIVLKTNLGRGTTLDKNLTKNLLHQMVTSFGKQTFPKIYLLHGSMKNEEIAQIYHDKKIKCFVGATRGEGFGLPIIDAAAAGMPVVATNWSGHLDFLKDSFSKVDYDLVEIRKEKADNRIFFEGFKWADPKESDFRKKVRSVYKNYNEHKLIAQNLKQIINEEYSSKKIKLMYDDLFEKMR